jgi:hypothetical protein
MARWNGLRVTGIHLMTDLTDNVDKLKRLLQDQGYELTELENGLQVQLDSGHLIEINALTRDSDYFWASFETQNMDSEKRGKEIASIHEPLAASLLGLAVLGGFEQTQDAEDRFVYVANVELDPSVTYYGAIAMDDLAAAQWPALPHRRKPMPPKEQARESAVSETEPVPENEPSDPMALARKALDQLETIDGKMIRKSLDMMNLRRSSNIRLMLTRIFRSAVDPGELMRSIRMEAEKVVSTEDRKELAMVQILSANSFLEPVVNLLCLEVANHGK